jgi:hypothetical protein
VSDIAARQGWALAAVVGDPQLWLLGAAGFLVRGGFLALAVPIWTLPTVIELTTLLGPDAIGPGGLTGRGVTVGLLAGAIVLAVVFAAVLTSAAIEIASWRRLHVDAESGVAPAPADPRSTGRIVLALAGIALACLVPALAAFAIATAAIVDAARTEILLPGSLAVPLELRIVQRAAPAVALVALGLVIGELLHGIASRRVLRGLRPARDLGLRADRGGLREAVGRSVGAIATATAGWLIWSAAAVPALASTAICWTFVRGAYRDAGRLATDDVPLLVGATILFVAVWLIALVFCGFASALRAGLWTARALTARITTSDADEAASSPLRGADRSGRLRPDDAVR